MPIRLCTAEGGGSTPLGSTRNSLNQRVSPFSAPNLVVNMYSFTRLVGVAVGSGWGHISSLC
jgi:hypothetical protein